MQNESNNEPSVSYATKFSFPIRVKYFLLIILVAFLFLTYNFTNYKDNYSIVSLKQPFNNANVMQFIQSFYSSSNKSDESSNEVILELPLTKNLTCLPFFTDREQYYANIDGVRYPKQVPLHKNLSINFECLDKSPNKKIILFYNTWFGSMNYAIGVGYRAPFSVQNCPVTSCETTSDINRLNESDFVITHMRDSIPKLPNFRPRNQRWIFLLYVRIF